jgi:hypothetical protein
MLGLSHAVCCGNLTAVIVDVWNRGGFFGIGQQTPSNLVRFKYSDFTYLLTPWSRGLLQKLTSFRS